METQEMQDTIQLYLDAYNHFDIDGMIAVLHPDIEFKNITNGETDLSLRGTAAFRAQAEKAAVFFRERKQTISAIVITEDTAEVSIDYEAVLATDLPNGLKAGESLQMKGMSIFRFEDQLIINLEDRS